MKSPAFQFYPRQFLGDDMVLLMSFEARGMHLHYMCIAWQQHPPCTLPDDDEMLQGWVRNPSNWTDLKKQIFRAWELKEGRWIQNGLLREWLKQQHFSESRSQNSKARWQKKSDAASALQVQSKCYPLQSSSSSADNNIYIRATPTKQDVVTFGKSIQCPEEDCLSFYNHFQSQDWLKSSGLRITDWKTRLEQWKQDEARKRATSQPGAKASGSSSGFKIRSVMDADSVLRECQSQINAIKNDPKKNPYSSGGQTELPGKRLTQEARKEIEGLEAKISEVRKQKSQLVAK